jgi:hypothetical protein
MSKSAYKGPSEKYDLYAALIAGHADIELKGKTMPYTSANGHMFSHLDKEGAMGLRLPSDARETFLADFQTELFVQHGRVMKEYVAVPAELLANTVGLQAHLAVSFDYVMSLKPKK